MKIVYTDIYNDLTKELLRISKEAISAGKKVFYIVPSSLSFDKEKEILERFNNGIDTSLFDLTVTRFKQLPWYFVKDANDQDKVELTNVGKAMLFKRVLSKFTKDELPLYHSMGSSSSFLDSLVDLHSELEKSNLTSSDMVEANGGERIKELALIIDQFDLELSEKYANYSKVDEFIDNIVKDKFTNSLQESIFIIDGYSRFSAEEESLITVLDNKSSDLIIGAYMSEKSYRSAYIQGSVYQNTIEMVNRFKKQYSAEVYKIVNKNVNNYFTDVSIAWENENDPTSTDEFKLEIPKNEENRLRIWKVINQKEEIEYVAKEIRQLLSNGVRYKDIQVLVGDAENYRIKLEQIFSLYEIPYFYSLEELMKNHPLITVIESLIRIKKYNYDSNDVINLLKTEMYKPIDYSLDEIYDFEFYIVANKIRGRKKYSEEFNGRFAAENIEEKNSLRESLLGDDSPIQKLLSNNNKRLAKTLINDFKSYLKESRIDEIMEGLFNQAENNNDFALANRHQQVWDLMLDSIDEFLQVFEGEKMTMLEFLELLYSGLSTASYRGIPSNVDVVNVRDYELVEPRSSKYVYAIGLSQANFPKHKTNSSLLSDEDRENINKSIEDTSEKTANKSKFIEQPSFTSNAKNIYNAMSLFNSATESLVLSSPQLYDVSQEEVSPYISFLINKSVNVEVKKGVNLNSSIEEIGNYRGLLSNLGKLERQMKDDTSNNQNEDGNSAFWRSMFRIIKNNKVYNSIIQANVDDIVPANLSIDVLEDMYEKNIYASVSSFETFYNCQYQYFINNSLRLQELETITVDSRTSGNYFHEVFEDLMKSYPSNNDFDEKLTYSLQKIYNENNYKYYFQDETGKYVYSRLKEIIFQTATMLKKVINNESISPQEFEDTFGFPGSKLSDYSVKIDENHHLKLRGKIDRIDKIVDSIGVVDYKSGNLDFDLNKVFNGQSLQFMTYLDTLKNNYQSPIWGATYLQLKNSAIKLNDLPELDLLPVYLLKNMLYKGVYNSEESIELRDTNLYNISKNNSYSTSEIDSLIQHNEKLYKSAANKLVTGQLAVNPVVEKDVAVGCRFCNLKAICKFEPDIHMKYGRKIIKQPKDAIFEEIADDRD